MRTCVMYYLDVYMRRVLFVRSNVTEDERMALLNDPRWMTAYWEYWEKT